VHRLLDQQAATDRGAERDAARDRARCLAARLSVALEDVAAALAELDADPDAGTAARAEDVARLHTDLAQAHRDAAAWLRDARALAARLLAEQERRDRMDPQDSSRENFTRRMAKLAADRAARGLDVPGAPAPATAQPATVGRKTQDQSQHRLGAGRTGGRSHT